MQRLRITHIHNAHDTNASRNADCVALARAQALAHQAGLELRSTDDGLVLASDSLELRVDFSDQRARLAPNNRSQELLLRAAKIRHNASVPTAIDCTAGLGKDALLLAATGFSVVLLERNPVIAALLRDALQRAAYISDLAETVSRITFIEADSIEVLPHLTYTPDVVYLDPMFPARRKSAAVKKAFQLLHRLEQPCKDQETLLATALATHPHKTIIKRPAKGPFLAGVTPSYSLSGKTVRYDCIVQAS